MCAVYRHTGPRDIHHCWIGEGDDAYCPCLKKGFPAFSGRLIVRSQRTRNISRGAAEHDGYLALEIEARKVVVIFFRNAQSVSHKNQRRLHLGSQVDPRAEERVFSKRERLNFATAD